MDFLGTNPAWALVLKATLAVKVVLLVLLCMSIYSWAIIFFKFLTFLKARRDVHLLRRLTEESSNLGSLKNVLETHSSRVGSAMLQKALFELKRIGQLNASEQEKKEIIKENLQRSLLNSRTEIFLSLKKSLAFLATCSNSAPFIGLFGTVWGIMHSFHAIGLQKSASLSTVAPGISEALIATAIGLAVAIPATMAYNYFITKLQDVDKDLDILANVFLNLLERNLSLLKQGEK